MVFRIRAWLYPVDECLDGLSGVTGPCHPKDNVDPPNGGFHYIKARSRGSVTADPFGVFDPRRLGGIRFRNAYSSQIIDLAMFLSWPRVNGSRKLMSTCIPHVALTEIRATFASFRRNRSTSLSQELPTI